MALPPNALLFQVNARQLVRETGAALGRSATLADVPAEAIARWSAQGFDAVWVMGVWETGEVGRHLSATDPAFAAYHADALPDWTEADVCGSPYAVAAYRVSPDFGGDAALADLRRRLADAGLALVLDFVPNHTARDHGWVAADPDLYVHGPLDLAERQPDAYGAAGDRAIAMGRDPYFPAWKDTYQLDYRRPATRARMIETLLSIAERCDGVRCDMAMLVLSDIFARTWGWQDGTPSEEFWAEAIDAVRASHTGFTFMAEAYWGLEDRLRLLGFDHTYHKEIYDTLVHRDLASLRGHLSWAEGLAGSVHFLENHDEPRAATALPDPAYRRAATALLCALPGVRLIHDGQMVARRRRHSIHLSRRMDEAADGDEAAFFDRLLGAVAASAIGHGTWQVIESRRTWAEADTQWAIVAILWQTADGARDLMVVNLADHDSEASLPLRFQGIAGRSWRLADRLSDEVHVRDGNAMSTDGLFVRLTPYRAQIFALDRA